ncbi:MAG: hypothetical protein ABI760_22380 [Ferruginibacter sp.]
MNTLKLVGLFVYIIFTFQNANIAKNKFVCPMSKGYIKLKKYSINGEIIDPRNSIIITGINDEVVSCTEGKVKKIMITEDSLYNIFITSSQYNFLYENLNIIAVKENQKIRSGQRIGKSFLKRLEFTIYKKDKTVDQPETLLNCKCSRQPQQ